MTAIAILLFSSPRCALLCCRLARCCSHHPSETHIAGLKLHGYFVVFFSRVCSPSPKRSLLASSLSPAETQLAGLSSTGFSTFFQLPVHPYPHLLLHQNRITMASCILCNSLGTHLVNHHKHCAICCPCCWLQLHPRPMIIYPTRLSDSSIWVLIVRL